MSDLELDSETKLKIYMLIVSRYKDMISKEEQKSISEIRQRISPYNDFIRKLKMRFIDDINPYEYNKHFFIAVQRVVDYIKGIKNFEFLIRFWMSFEEIDKIKAADIMDQALLLTSLLRSLGSESAKVHMTMSRKTYVGFEWGGEKYLINPESGSILRGDDVQNIFSQDKLNYSFNDLSFDSYIE